MSDFGELPIIHVESRASPRSSTNREYAAASFSLTTALCAK